MNAKPNKNTDPVPGPKHRHTAARDKTRTGTRRAANEPAVSRASSRARSNRFSWGYCSGLTADLSLDVFPVVGAAACVGLSAAFFSSVAGLAA